MSRRRPGGCSVADAATTLRPAPRIDIALGSGAFRRTIGATGRAHVDRCLPFLILNRFAPGDSDSLATRVATTSPAYVVWPGQADREALAMVAAIAGRRNETRPRMLLVSLYDLARDEWLDDTDPELERFVCRIGVSADPAARAAAHCLEEALAKLSVDLRTCTIQHTPDGWFEPGIETLLQEERWLSHISLGLPQNYRVPGDNGIYPQLLHELTVGVFDALLQGCRAFIAAANPPAPRSHRALGRSAFIDAARKVDRKLFRIAKSFDFLLSVSPIDTAAAHDRFRAGGYDEEPVFHYRPLTVDPDVAKRALYAIDLRQVEDPVLETLFAEKRRELDQQFTMLACRNTPGFRYASLMLYGTVEPALRDAARDILANVRQHGARSDGVADAHAVCVAARDLIGRYRAANPAFRAKVGIRKDIAAGLMVSGHELMVSADTNMPEHRLPALLQHEISVHLLTCVNGAAQGLKIFESGLAGYEGVQEGLGVFAECAVGGMTAARLRLLAARVLVVDAMIDGAGFIDAFRLLHDEHGFSARGAFNIVARVYRSGGLAKDAIYLRGLKEVLDLLAAGCDLAPFWVGKIAARHLPIVEELSARGLLRPALSIPAFLDDPQARQRIEALRVIDSFADLL